MLANKQVACVGETATKTGFTVLLFINLRFSGTS